MSKLVIYETNDGQPGVSVRLEGETVWFTQRQMGDRFDTSTDNISLHIKNIYSDAELNEASTTEDFPVVQIEGKRQVTRTVKQYNLGTILFATGKYEHDCQRKCAYGVGFAYRREQAHRQGFNG